MVVGSSGLWKVFSPTELVQLLAQEKSIADAADKAISEARHRWEELWQGALSDRSSISCLPERSLIAVRRREYFNSGLYTSVMTLAWRAKGRIFTSVATLQKGALHALERAISIILFVAIPF